VIPARLVALAAALLIAATFSTPIGRSVVAPTAEAAAAVRVTWHPRRPSVGSVAWLHVQGLVQGATLEGTVSGRSLTFFPYGDGQAALVGFDLDARPGVAPWALAIVKPNGEGRVVRGRVAVQRRDFPVQRLTLPRSMVDLDPATERRAVQEGEQLRMLYRMISPERLWHGPFSHPLGAHSVGTNFGSRRIINGQSRAPHGGADYPAPSGTPVVATNAGRVALVAEYFFPGRLVALDHGLGLHTLYFHLERVSVVEGEGVERGQVLGTVGATGRATGPHLHFGVQVGPARVDPASLFELIFSD